MEIYVQQFEDWIKNNQLLRFDLVFTKLGRRTLLARMLTFDASNGNILVYVDDTKKIEIYTIHEIDDISAILGTNSVRL